jgi:hypothetical protein
MRYWLPLFIAVVLIAIVLGRAHPAGQICQETRTLRQAAGILPSEPLHKLQTQRLEALLKDSAPACAIEQLAQPDYSTVKQARNVPANVSGIGAVRAWITNLRLDITGWVLLAIAALLVLRTGLAFVISRRPGIVNVGTVTDATKEKNPPDPAIVVQIQQRLTEQHLFGATLVPGGGLPEAVATTLKDTDVPNAKSLAALIGLIPKLLPKSGVTVDAVVRSREETPKQGCTITLTDVSSGRVLDTFTQWRADIFDAVDAVAICAIAHILDRDPVRRRTPNWSRFGERSRKALEALAMGDDDIAEIGSESAARQGYEQAIKNYKAALAHDPSNLSIAMRLGSAQELLAAKKRDKPKEMAEQMFEAAETYLRAHNLWTYAYAPRYRAAIALAACAEHVPSIKERLSDLGLNNKTDCRNAAGALLQELVDDLAWSKVLLRWLETFYRKREREAGTRRYFQRFVKPFSRERLQLRGTYEMARYVVLFDSGDKTTYRDSAVAKLLCEKFPRSYTLRALLRVNWQVRYNATCYYSRRAKSAQADEKKWLLHHANRLLEEVLRDPRHEVTGAWLRRDPDLASLRKWEGGGWNDVNVIGELGA